MYWQAPTSNRLQKSRLPRTQNSQRNIPVVLTDMPDVNNFPPWNANHSLTSMSSSLDKSWSTQSRAHTLLPLIQGSLINPRLGASLSCDWAMLSVFLPVWLTLPNPLVRTDALQLMWEHPSCKHMRDAPMAFSEAQNWLWHLAEAGTEYSSNTRAKRKVSGQKHFPMFAPAK